MKTAADCLVVYVTAPDLEVARKLAHAVLTARVAACANLLPNLESHYWWQGKMESSAEVLMVLKTTRRRLAKLEKTIKELHPYDTPEIIALPLQSGSEKYLIWLRESVTP